MSDKRAELLKGAPEGVCLMRGDAHTVIRFWKIVLVPLEDAASWKESGWVESRTITLSEKSKMVPETIYSYGDIVNRSRVG